MKLGLSLWMSLEGYEGNISIAYIDVDYVITSWITLYYVLVMNWLVIEVWMSHEGQEGMKVGSSLNSSMKGELLRL